MRGVLIAGLAFFVVGCGCQQATSPDTEASSVTPANKSGAADAQAGQAAEGGPKAGVAAPTKGSDSELEVNPNANFNTGR